jgi:hypothetical protein
MMKTGFLHLVRAAAALAILGALSASLAAPPELPDKAPVPALPERPPSGMASPPLPEPRPETAPAEQQGPPASAAPAPRPFPPRPPPSAEEQKACINELRKLGVAFSVEEPVSDPAGCAIANPVLVNDLGPTFRMAPQALLDCPMALAAARFMRDVAAPEARGDLGADLVAVNHASAYVCRPRHGGEKPSEHAFGNALDIAGFGLSDGRQIDVKAGATETEQKFLDAIRKAACGPFKTVLGPGSDADHAQHFHFDLQPRRTGSTFCR